MDKRYSLENLQTEIKGKTPKESIKAIQACLDFYYEWKYKNGKDYTGRLFEFDFYDKAKELLKEFENIDPIAYNRELNWYFNTDNVGNDELTFATEHFLNNERKGMFDTAYFFNMLFRQMDALKDSLDTPIDYLNSLKALPFNNEQQYLLFGMILYWHGGYPINNFNPKYNITLKLVEREFLSMFPDTEMPEKEFCKADSKKRNHLMKLGIAFTTAINNNMDALEILDAMPESEPWDKNYSNFNELFKAAAHAEALGKFESTQVYLIERSKYNYEFNVWLQEMKGWEYGNEIDYQKYLTRQFFVEFLKFQRKQEEDRITEHENEKGKWKIETPQQIEIETRKSNPEIKPIFKPEAVQRIFDLLKDFFSKEHQIYFKEILETGNNACEQLIFLHNGNRLADAFKQLIDSDFIIGCSKKELETWIAQSFKYKHRGEIKAFTLRYLNDIISTNSDKCKSAILNVKKDKTTGEYLINKV